MTPKHFINTVHTARIDLLDLAEHLGGIATLLRESEDDARRNASTSAMLCLDDACNLVCTLEAEASNLAAKLATLRESVEQHA